MQYYAKTYTADPKTGLLTPGEFLTEAQVAALGEDRIANMVERGVLAVTGGTPAQTEAPAKSEKPAKKKDKKPEPVTEADTEDEDEDDTDSEDEDDGDEGDDGEAEDDEDELPELDAAGAIDEEEKPAEKPAKSGKGRKTK